MNQLNYKFGPDDEDEDEDWNEEEPFVEEDEFPCCPPDEDPGNYGLDGF